MAVPIIPKSECYNKPSKKSSSFGLEMNASTLKALSQTLYDYKIEAVLREYSTNITDSHNDSGKEGLAGYVHVPTKLKPVVEFHDFGLGMSEETIFSVYTVFGCSTKRGDNTTSGSLGFGSKSFNTVSDQMTVTSTKDGVKTVVLCYKDRKGELTADVKSSTKTNDPNGTVISIPVDPAKVSLWQSTAARVLGAFRTPHKTNGFGDYQSRYDQMVAMCKEVRENGTMFYQNRNSVMNDLRSNTWVLMGDVMYTLPDFDTLLPSSGEFLPAVKGMISTGTYITEFKIGEVDHAPSRESISYDEETFIRCKHRVRKDIIKHFKKFQVELGDMKNISFYRFYNKYYDTPIYESLWDIPLPFLRGKTLRTVCPSKSHAYCYNRMLFLSNFDKYGKIRGLVPDAGNYRQIFSSSVELFDQGRLCNITDPVILYSENEKGIYKIQETCKNSSEKLGKDNILVVDSLVAAQNVYDFFGCGQILCGDTYSPEKVKRAKGEGNKRGSFGIKEDYQTTGHVYTISENRYTSSFGMIDLSEEGVCYIGMEGIEVSGIVKGKKTNLSMSYRLAELLYKVGVRKVVVENKNNTGKIKRSGIKSVDSVIASTVKPLKKDIIKGSVWGNKFNLPRHDEPLRNRLPAVRKFDSRADVTINPLAESILNISKFGLESTKAYKKELESQNKLYNKVEESLQDMYTKLPLWKHVRVLDEEKIEHYLKLEKIIK